MIIVNNNNHDLLQLSIFPKDLFLNAHVSGPASFSVIGFFTLNSPMKSPASPWLWYLGQVLAWKQQDGGFHFRGLPGVSCSSTSYGLLVPGLLDES